MGCDSSSIKDTTINIPKDEANKITHIPQTNTNQTNHIVGAAGITHDQMSSIKSMSGDGVYSDHSGSYYVGGDKVIFNSDGTILSIGGSAPHNWGSIEFK